MQARFGYDARMRLSLAPVTRALLFANIGVFVLQLLLGDRLFILFALWPPASTAYPGAPAFRLWQLLTYGFLHGNLTHLLFNMLALYMFGTEVERLLGARRFLIYYLVCVVGAAVAQLLVVGTLDRPPLPTVGASGGVFGLLLAFGLAYPHRRIMLLFPPIPMPAWVFVTLYGGLELYLGVTGTNEGVAHFAHLGGMAAGYVMLSHWRRTASR
ncbi:MAG TPA: rhomboid family intramembrane serine protease [Mycobacterium sp.]|nr:rhomboid family intramembrane serine protease [Mycobacterium sp.]